MPSLWEGLPLSLVLAMGAGLPVVASRVAGIPEVVEDDVSGLLVDPGDSDAAGRAPGRALVERRARCARGSAHGSARVRVPRFGVDGYVASITALYDRLLAAKGIIVVTLGILYHMPFWQAADGSLWEAEGSFARYVDSLAPYFDESSCRCRCSTRRRPSGSRVRAANVRLAPLPYFPGPRQFYPMLPRLYGRLQAWVDAVRRHSPARADAGGDLRVSHRRARMRKPIFLLVVGDYEALLPHLPYRGIKKVLFRALRRVRGVGAPPHDVAAR